MKKNYVIFTLCSLLYASAAYTQTFNDDFESYTVGSSVGASSQNWQTWGGQNPSEDATVVNTDNHTPGGSKSIYISSPSNNGGAVDLVLPFGPAVHASDIFTFTNWIKVPNNKSGYFNFQGDQTMGISYAMDCYLDTSGVLTIFNGSNLKLTTTYPQGAWFELKIVSNLSSKKWELYINGIQKGFFISEINKLAAVNYYSYHSTNELWIDDVHYNKSSLVLPNINGLAESLSLGSGLIGQTRTPNGLFKNVGNQAVTSFDASLLANGVVINSQNLSGLNIPTLANYSVIFPNITLTSTPVKYSFLISNINGLGADSIASDDTVSTSVHGIQAAAGKRVTLEEGTGTWCAWCPRGAVFMDLMYKKYKSVLTAIAVHNGPSDPMRNIPYDQGMSTLIQGYPSVVADRNTEFDPAFMEAEFFQKIQIAPKAVIVNGATYNSNTRQLKVSLTTNVQTAFSGNYKIACVLTEDSVTGTTLGYAQSNAYSGNNNGVMGGFELLPPLVPASLMNYNHVARLISPSFNGHPNAFGTTIAGQTITHTFTFTLPATWDADQIHISGLLINPTGKIDNSSNTTINEAVANGYVIGTEILTVSKLNQMDAKIALYPNPTSNNSNIIVNLEKESDVEVSVCGLNGAIIANKKYGRLSGSLTLPIEISTLNAGIYFVTVNINGEQNVFKLIKD